MAEQMYPLKLRLCLMKLAPDLLIQPDRFEKGIKLIKENEAFEHLCEPCKPKNGLKRMSLCDT